MKNYLTLFYFGLITILLVGCKDEPTYSEQLIGVWETIESNCGTPFFSSVFDDPAITFTDTQITMVYEPYLLEGEYHISGKPVWG